MTNNNSNNNNTTTTTKTVSENSGVHAVLKNTNGDVLTMSAKTRTELAKMLQGHPDYNVLHVYKGKKLNVKEKVSFSFN